MKKVSIIIETSKGLSRLNIKQYHKMNRLVRQLLFMFGPLILRQVTKVWRNKDKKQQWNTPGQQDQRDYREAPQKSRSNRKPEPETIKVEPKLSEEERNFRLDEDDIMLEEKDLKYTKEGKFEGLEDVDDTDPMDDTL